MTRVISAPRPAMFLSHPRYELHLPEFVANPGARHWRMVEMTLHAPWFLLTIELPDEGNSGVQFTHTLCFALERDLISALSTMDAAIVRGLVCMMPAWCSPNGQWSSREVREVWEARDAFGEFAVLRDANGDEFDATVSRLSQQGATKREVTDRRLILKLHPVQASVTKDGLARERSET